MTSAFCQWSHSEGAAFPYHFICKSMPLLNVSDQPETMNKIFSWVQSNKMFQSMHITQYICIITGLTSWQRRLLVPDWEVYMLAVIVMISWTKQTVLTLNQTGVEEIFPRGECQPDVFVLYILTSVIWNLTESFIGKPDVCAGIWFPNTALSWARTVSPSSSMQNLKRDAHNIF